MDLLAQATTIVEKILPAVQALAARLGEDATPAAARLDPRELEAQCRDLGLAVGHELFAALVRGYGTGQQATPPRCACGGQRRWVGLRPRTVRDVMNRTLTLERAYYYCAGCGQGWLPLDEALGLPRGAVTPALYEVAVTCGSVAPPEEAAELLARVAGITLSPKSIERYTKAAGAAVERAVDARAADPTAEAPTPTPGPAPAARPYNLQFDGGMIRMRDGTWREVKVACLFDARERAAVQAARHLLLHPHYEVQLGGPARLGQLTYAAARAAGVAPDGANAISQGDGAPWVWNLVQEHWPAVWEVLDYYHFSEHLHAAAQTLWGAESATARQWARTVGEQTLAADATVAIRALRGLRPRTAAHQAAVTRLRRYIQTHAHRMAYGALRAQGYAVASAAVESAHHSVVQRRLKRPGQRWTETGARQIVAARRLWCNRHSSVDVSSLATVRYLVGPGYRRRVA